MEYLILAGYIIGVAAVMAYAGWNEEDELLFLSFVWPLVLALLILLAPYWIALRMRENRRYR